LTVELTAEIVFFLFSAIMIPFKVLKIGKRHKSHTQVLRDSPTKTFFFQRFSENVSES